MPINTLYSPLHLSAAYEIRKAIIDFLTNAMKAEGGMKALLI
jgi:hypothetical protein